MSDLLRPPTLGTERFACECGVHFTEGYLAIQHTFAGHETCVERYSIDGWRFKTRNVGELIVERLREKGEDVESFVRRIQKAADAAQARAESDEYQWVR